MFLVDVISYAKMCETTFSFVYFILTLKLERRWQA